MSEQSVGTIGTIGVIGGSGLYDIPGLEGTEWVRVETPFGDPSDQYLVGSLREGDRRVRLIFLPRHGRGHRFSPSEINYRANIYGMKRLGAQALVSFSAVGSMREEIAPGDLVIVDQFFDRTKGRPFTFFDGGVVAHVGFADPVCPALAGVLYDSAKAVGATVHRGGTYVVMEGPAFSTRAESRIYRSWGVDVIGMTNLPEAKLAREAELCYATVALATDYDCWHESEEDVSVEAVLKIMQKNVATAREVLRAAVFRVPAERGCGCGHALAHAIMTDRAAIPGAARARLGLFIDKYL
jgi:5'-methylthioadenosine phosphorylase